MKPKHGRYMNDDGTEFNPNLAPKPSLCVNCAKDEDAAEEILCNLTRADQQDEQTFECDAFQPKDSRPEKKDDDPVRF